MIYFMQAASGPIKVGSTSNVPNRARAIQNQRREDVSILFMRDGSIREERALQRYLSADSIGGEWFHPSQRVIECIARLDGGESADTITAIRWDVDAAVVSSLMARHPARGFTTVQRQGAADLVVRLLSMFSDQAFSPRDILVALGVCGPLGGSYKAYGLWNAIRSMVRSAPGVTVMGQRYRFLVSGGC